MLVECRVPSYNRPDLLDRALRSLQSQDHREWVAVVLDDSREASGLSVVETLGDPRIRYHQNAKRLGSTGNLNLAFGPRPMAGGKYAFILEDDNAITPDFITTGLRYAVNPLTPVVSLNQRCVVVDRLGEAGQASGGALRAEDSQPSIWSLRRLVLNVFLKPSLPNGCYFWKLGVCDLTVDQGITEPMLQESARQLAVGERIVLCPEVGSLWSSLPASLIRRDSVSAQVFRVTRDLLAIALLRAYSKDTLVRWAQTELDEVEKSRFCQRLASLGCVFLPCATLFCDAPIEAMKNLLRHCLYRRRVDSPTREALKRFSLNEASL